MKNINSAGQQAIQKREIEISLRLINFVLPMYNQLISEQRYVISSLLNNKIPVKRIAEEIGCHISTVYREIKRNAGKRRHYSPRLAQEMAMERRERIVANGRLKPGVVKRAITLLCQEQWSPKQISGALAREGIRISHESIYRIIRADKTGELASHTRHGMRHRKRCVCGKSGVKNIPNRISIHDRPLEADGTRFGDWEMDLIVDPQQNAIVTLTERSTNFILMRRLPEGKKAAPLAKVVTRMLFAWRQGVKTITTDNGGEFAAHEDITNGLKRKSLPDVKVYFTDPYASWQKGAIENANGLIRQYIPKGVSFNNFSDRDIMNIQHKLNRRPRQKLNFRAPIALFNHFFRFFAIAC